MKPYSFFLFVNPTSGGNRAGIYLQLQADTIVFSLKQTVNVYFINLFEKDKLPINIEKLKLLQQTTNTRAIVCGGDGTVMWVVEELVKYKVDLTQCPIGIIPFGTGNDFSRVLGWGGDTSDDLGTCLSKFKTRIQDWINAKIEDFDIWEVNIFASENGFFRRIKKQDGGFTKEVLYDKDLPKKELKKKLSNYFSLGVDARIGYGFDKKRTQSACCNKCVYFCEGIKKMCLSNPAPGQVLQSMEIIADEHIGAICVDPQNVKQVLFQTKKLEENVYNFKGNPVTLLCLNIPSYSGGAGAIWDNCQGITGLKKQQQSLADNFHTQQFGDGEIEFVSFNTMIGMANERFLHGQASRVAQGKGPFMLRFKQGKLEGDKDVAPYIQIDGEFYQIVKPSHIILGHSKEVPNGKIKVLVFNRI